jgi:hypothetical protein
MDLKTEKKLERRAKNFRYVSKSWFPSDKVSVLHATEPYSSLYVSEVKYNMASLPTEEKEKRLQPE